MVTAVLHVTEKALYLCQIFKIEFDGFTRLKNKIENNSTGEGAFYQSD